MTTASGSTPTGGRDKISRSDESRVTSYQSRLIDRAARVERDFPTFFIFIRRLSSMGRLYDIPEGIRFLFDGSRASKRVGSDHSSRFANHTL